MITYYKGMNDKFNNTDIHLIIGLGNPGSKFEKTYHNVGKDCVKYLTHEHEYKKTKYFEYAKNNDTAYITPLVFMNDSGSAVSAALKYFKCNPNDIVVIHDDADLPLGTHKHEWSRGSAGHHGVNSIIKAINTKNFWRIRIGIRYSEVKDKKSANFVLKKMTPQHITEMETIFEKIKKLLVVS